MKEITIHSFEELQELVFKGIYDPKLKRYRNNFVYRGVRDSRYTLMTKLNRICGHDLSLEKSIIRSFVKYGYADIGSTKSIWQTLSLGQHFGLPTRLLDWSYSPLVAAHFVTKDINHYDVDGAIYCMDLEDSMKVLPKKLKDELKKAKASSFTIQLLEKNAKSLEDLKKLSKKPYFLFLEPASADNRMVNQYALFSVCSDPKYTIDELSKSIKGSTLYKIIIPKEVKLEIRDKLDYINISERVLFPGLGGVCSWITRHYANLGNIKKL